MLKLTLAGGDISFDVKVMAGYRRFCNKIYQATKYVLGKLPDGYVPRSKPAKTGRETLSERWILHRLNAAAQTVHEALEQREFSRSSQAVYRYWYDDVCDVFIVSLISPSSCAILTGPGKLQSHSPGRKRRGQSECH